MSTGQKLARWIDYRRSALEQMRFEGELTLDDLPRLREVVCADSCVPVRVSLVFGEDEQRRVIYTGRFEASLILPCQRCLEQTQENLACNISGIVVNNDEAAAAVPRAWEPVIAEDGMLDLHALAGDELLLALPMTIQCDRPACQAAHGRCDDVSGQESQQIGDERPNPFANLAVLKHKDDESR